MEARKLVNDTRISLAYNRKFIIDLDKKQLLYSRFIMSKLVLSVCLLILASAVQFRGFKHGELSEMKMKK